MLRKKCFDSSAFRTARCICGPPNETDRLKGGIKFVTLETSITRNVDCRQLCFQLCHFRFEFSNASVLKNSSCLLIFMPLLKTLRFSEASLRLDVHLNDVFSDRCKYCVEPSHLDVFFLSHHVSYAPNHTHEISVGRFACRRIHRLHLFPHLCNSDFT